MESEAHDNDLDRRTPAEVEAEILRHTTGVNAVLASMVGLQCRWWSYSVSHRTLEMVIGDAMARGGNLVVCLRGCTEIAGPVQWNSQRLQVVRRREEGEDGGSRYLLFDDAAAFKAAGGVISFCRDYDLVKHGSLSFPTR